MGKYSEAVGSGVFITLDIKNTARDRAAAFLCEKPS